MVNRTIGVAGDYANIQAVTVALNNGGAGIADDWTLTQISDITEGGVYSNFNANGFTVRFTVGDGNWHKGDPTAGYQVNVGADISVLSTINDNGTVIWERMRFVKTAPNTGGAGSDTILLRVYGGAAGGTSIHYVRDMIFDGQGFGGAWNNRGFEFGGNTSQRDYISNCKVFDTTDWGIALNQFVGGGGGIRKFLENCTAYNCETGFYVESETNNPGSNFECYVRNCIATDSTNTDWNLPDADGGLGSVNVLNNCADSDNSIAGTAFQGSGGATDCLGGLASADCFESTTDTDSNFLFLTEGSTATGASIPEVPATATASPASGRAPLRVSFAGVTSISAIPLPDVYTYAANPIYNAGIAPQSVTTDITGLTYGEYENNYPIGCHNVQVTRV